MIISDIPSLNSEKIQIKDMFHFALHLICEIAEMPLRVGSIFFPNGTFSAFAARNTNGISII